jgi:hypothetical protein
MKPSVGLVDGMVAPLQFKDQRDARQEPDPDHGHGEGRHGVPNGLGPKVA